MARRHAPLEPPRTPPRLLAQALPEGAAADDLELDGARVEAGAEAMPVVARSVEIVESDLTGVTFDADVLRRLDVRDSLLRTCDLSNVGARKGLLRRVELRQSRLVGLALTESELQDVRVLGGTLMLASFGHSRLERVVFEEVNLRDASFADTRLDEVSFLDCDLTGADFRGAKLRDCLMRGTSLEGIGGIESLSGLTLPWPDLVASTAALAAALGISVEAD